MNKGSGKYIISSLADEESWPRRLLDSETTAADALFRAVESGSTSETVAYLVNSPAMVHCARAPEEDFPLYLAAGLGDAELVEALLNHGASTEQVTKCGHTALAAAALFGHVKIAEILLGHGEHGADSLNRANAEGQSLLDEVLEDAVAAEDDAERTRLLSTAKLLLRYGAMPTKATAEVLWGEQLGTEIEEVIEALAFATGPFCQSKSLDLGLPDADYHECEGAGVDDDPGPRVRTNSRDAEEAKQAKPRFAHRHRVLVRASSSEEAEEAKIRMEQESKSTSPMASRQKNKAKNANVKVVPKPPSSPASPVGNT